MKFIGSALQSSKHVSYAEVRAKAGFERLRAAAALAAAVLTVASCKSATESPRRLEAPMTKLLDSAGKELCTAWVVACVDRKSVRAEVYLVGEAIEQRVQLVEADGTAGLEVTVPQVYAGEVQLQAVLGRHSLPMMAADVGLLPDVDGTVSGRFNAERSPESSIYVPITFRLSFRGATAEFRFK